MKPHKPYGVWLLILILFVLALSISLVAWWIEIKDLNQSLNIWLDGGAVQKGLK